MNKLLIASLLSITALPNAFAKELCGRFQRNTSQGLLKVINYELHVAPEKEEYMGYFNVRLIASGKTRAETELRYSLLENFMINDQWYCLEGKIDSDGARTKIFDFISVRKSEAPDYLK